VYAHADRSLGIQGRVQRKSQVMMALESDEAQPFQFVFDRSQLGFTRETGSIQWAFVVSDARATLGYTDDQWTSAMAEAAQQLRIGFWPRLDQVITEKRATFVCKPALKRPSAKVCSNLYLAGDYVEGLFPATLEGAVLSGSAAARSLEAQRDKYARPAD
jgi:hydroxysqualene dehydroxylase